MKQKKHKITKIAAKPKKSAAPDKAKPEAQVADLTTRLDEAAATIRELRNRNWKLVEQVKKIISSQNLASHYARQRHDQWNELRELAGVSRSDKPHPYFG